MNSKHFLSKQELLTIAIGIVKTLVAIPFYRFLVNFIDTNWRENLFTLILLITPIMLYLTLKKLVARFWNYRIKFVWVLTTGILFTLVSGIGIGILDYLFLYFKVSGFEASQVDSFQTPFVQFLIAYITWYACMGLVASPLIYLILNWQLKRSK